MLSKYSVTEAIKGTIIGVRKVQDRGRVQVPPEILEKVGVGDGDRVYWVEGEDGRCFITKAVKIS